MKLNEIFKRFENGENATALMSEMERYFNIPVLNDEEYNKANLEVIELYRKIADSRNL